MWEALSPVGLSELFREARTGASALIHRPEHRRLRWILATGLIVRFVLAPLTSWGIDTPTFVLADVGLLYTGSPYSSDLFFNPPVGPLLELPLFAVLTLFVPSTSLVPVVPALTPVAVSSGLASNLVPIPIALLALKLPLILADVVSTLVLYRLVLPRAGVAAAQATAALWFLNPLLIWVSSVHGEVDGLAALFLLLFVASLERDWPLASGVWLALAIFTKAFPLSLLPIGIAYWAMAPLPGRSGWRPRFVLTLKFAAGCGAVVLALLPLVSAYFGAVVQSTSTTFYGGMSPLVLYNLAVGRLPGAWGAWEAHQYAPVALDLLRVLAVVGVAGATYAVARHRWHSATSRVPLEVLALVALWGIIAVILSASSPQSETMVEPLALLLLSGTALGRLARPAYLALSAAAFGLYLTLLGPAAYFYPLAVAIGPPAVGWVNSVTLGFLSGVDGVGPPVYWLITGLVGGGWLVILWVLCLRRFYRGAPSGGEKVPS